MMREQSPFDPTSPFREFNNFFERFGFSEFENFERKINALGSGFIIDPEGYIVTNHHVIKNADEIKVKIVGLDNELKAKVIGSDSRTDLALLKVETKKPLPFVKFGNSDKARVGEWVIAIGNPMGLGGTVTTGIISSKSRDLDMPSHKIVDDYIQTDAAINQGNSGGPMFNIKGEVIGVNTVIYANSTGIGFAVPANIAASIMQQLKANGKIIRGMLQARVQDLTDEISESIGMKEPYGALVVDLEPNGPADQAGLKSGDVIIKYNDKKINNASKLIKMVAETKINSEVNLQIIRNNKELTLKTVLTTRKEEKATGQLKLNGINFGNITGNIIDKYELENNITGVVVIAASKHSAWARLGIKKGDVITSINQQKIANINDVERIFEQAKKDKKKNILFLIHRKNMSVFLAMPMDAD